VSVGDKVFSADCVIHINGSPDRNLSVAGFKQMMAGLLAAFPDLRLTIEDHSAPGDKVARDGSRKQPIMALGETSRRLGRRVRVDGPLSIVSLMAE